MQHLGESDIDVILDYPEGGRYKLRRVIRKDKYYESSYQAKLYQPLDDGAWDCIHSWDATDEEGDPSSEDELLNRATTLLHDYWGESEDDSLRTYPA